MLSRTLQLGCLPIGVDIGAGGVKLAQLKPRGGGLEVNALARIDLPAGGVRPDDPGRLDALVELIARKVQSGGFSGKRCAISLDDRMVRTRSVRQPRMPLNELDAAARLDAPGRLGYPDGDSCEVGWLLAGEVRQNDDIRDEVIYVGSERQPIERLVYALSGAGLRPMSIEPGFTACTRCFTRSLRRAADQSTVQLIVDIGLETTGVILTRGRSVAFYKQLEMGGAALTRAASERLGLEPATVDDLRRRRMQPDAGGSAGVDPKVDRALYDAVRPLMGDLAHEVSLCVRYYSVTFRGAKPERCILAGGEAAEPRLAECFQDALHLSTGVGRPLEELTSPNRTNARVRGSGAEWATSVGLSLRGRDDAKARRRAAAKRSAGTGRDERGRGEARAAA